MKTIKRWLPIGAIAAAVLLVVAACSDGSDERTPSAPGGPGAGSATGDAGTVAGLEARLAAALGSVGNQQTGIWVDGSGSVVAAPDVAVLSFAIETRAETVTPARSAAAAAMDAVLKSIRANGVADRDIKTTSFSIQPIVVYRERTYPAGGRDQEPVIVGYRVSNGATAKIRRIDTAGTVIDAAAQAGGDAIRINGIAFTIDDPKPLERQARDLALRDAIAKARQIAEVTGVTLGAPTLITQQGGAPIIQKAELFARGAAADVVTPIVPGEAEVTVQVQVVFAIR